MAARFRPALFTSLRNGYSRAQLFADLGSGLLVGVVALPLAMAFGIASGCTAEQGLFTAIIAGGIISLLGGSRYQIGGPTGAFVGLCASSVATYGYQGLALATMCAGVLLLCMGFLRLGKAISYIPIPVVIGFTSGIAVVIASTQLKELFGLTYAEKPGDFVGRVEAMWTHFATWKPVAAILAATTAAIMIVLRRMSLKIPGALIAIVLLTGIVQVFHVDVATIGAIPSSLPKPALPEFHGTWADLGAQLIQLRWLIVAIALLGAIESLLSAVVADGMTGDRHDPDTELIAQGIANLASPLFRGLPATGAIARTATNIRAGAQSPLSGVIHAIVLLALIMAAAPLAAGIPLACLSGVLLVVCWNMAEARHWPHILKSKLSDAFLLLVVFLLTVFVDLTVAVVVGVLLAMIFFVRRMAEVTTVKHYAEPATRSIKRSEPLPPGVEVYDVRGVFFFGVASLIRDILQRIGERPKVLVLRIRDVPFVDATAMFALRDLAEGCRKQGVTLILAEVRERPLKMLKKSGFLKELGEENVFTDNLKALDYAVKQVA